MRHTRLRGGLSTGSSARGIRIRKAALRRLARPAARLAAAGAASLGAAQLAGSRRGTAAEDQSKNRTGGVADESTDQRAALAANAGAAT